MIDAAAERGSVSNPRRDTGAGLLRQPFRIAHCARSTSTRMPGISGALSELISANRSGVMRWARQMLSTVWLGITVAMCAPAGGAGR